VARERRLFSEEFKREAVRLVGSVLETVELLAAWQADFRRNYRRMLNVLLSRKRPIGQDKRP
jgi:transposase-like protein